MSDAVRHHPTWSEVRPKYMSSILTPIDATCLTCRWWSCDATDGSPDSCHRHAPPWPPASETDWCGDWEQDFTPLLKSND